MVTAGDWVALAGIILSALLAASGVVYKLGQLANVVTDLGRRVSQNEERLARIERKIDRRNPLCYRGIALVALSCKPPSG